MAEYENPEIPEGINVTPTHPLKEFALLLGGISALVVVVVLALALLAGYLVRFVPFAQEQALASGIHRAWFDEPADADGRQKEKYLQSLADRLSASMDLPPGMQVTLHYSSAETVNALATFGGHIIVFQGLLDAVPNENALAMVIAHEIAHIRHRHPIIAMGRGFTVLLALSALSGVGDDLMQQWVGSMGMLPVLAFSRAQEDEADADALQALQKTYGHVGGAASFFEHIAGHQHFGEHPELFATHANPDERIARIQRFSREHGMLPTQALIALPDFLRPGL
jgi:predicted Zn-dependent protease